MLVETFVAAATAAGATVHMRHHSKDSLLNGLHGILQSNQQVVVQTGNILTEKLVNELSTACDITLKPTLQDLANAHVGISEAMAGIATSGSVCFNANHELHAYISLLPEKHIVLLRTDSIVERPKDLIGAESSDAMVYVTGPSATADMGSLVRGAHGPAELEIILIN